MENLFNKQTNKRLALQILCCQIFYNLIIPHKSSSFDASLALSSAEVDSERKLQLISCAVVYQRISIYKTWKLKEYKGKVK